MPHGTVWMDAESRGADPEGDSVQQELRLEFVMT